MLRNSLGLCLVPFSANSPISAICHLIMSAGSLLIKCSPVASDERSMVFCQTSFQMRLWERRKVFICSSPCTILACDWSRQVTWPQYWPLIGSSPYSHLKFPPGFWVQNLIQSVSGWVILRMTEELPSTKSDIQSSCHHTRVESDQSEARIEDELTDQRRMFLGSGLAG